jgi:hypothetical protein
VPGDHPPAEEVFAERVARLVRLVERWHARVETGRWPAVPPTGLERDDPRRDLAPFGEGRRGQGQVQAHG